MVRELRRRPEERSERRPGGGRVARRDDHSPVARQAGGAAVGDGNDDMDLSACGVVLLALAPALASQVRPLNLEEMTARADRILSARCTGVKLRRDRDLDQTVTEVTFTAHRAVKGGARGAFTIRLFGDGDAASPREGSNRAASLFRPGEEVVLFLYPDSSAGLTSPVGLGQGKFLVARSAKGDEVASNGFADGRLFRGLSREALKRIGAEAARWEKRGGGPADSLLDMAAALDSIRPGPGPRSK